MTGSVLFIPWLASPVLTQDVRTCFSWEHGMYESQNHRMVWGERDLKATQCQAPAPGYVTVCFCVWWLCLQQVSMEVYCRLFLLKKKKKKGTLKCCEKKQFKDMNIEQNELVRALVWKLMTNSSTVPLVSDVLTAQCKHGQECQQ